MAEFRLFRHNNPGWYGETQPLFAQPDAMRIREQQSWRGVQYVRRPGIRYLPNDAPTTVQEQETPIYSDITKVIFG